MNSLVRAEGVRFDEDGFWVELSDGRALSVPLAWSPRLLRASPAQRQAVSLSSRGLHWDELDEDISVGGSGGPGRWDAGRGVHRRRVRAFS